MPENELLKSGAFCPYTGRWIEADENNNWVTAPSSFAINCAATESCTPGSAFSFDPTSAWANLKTCTGCTACYKCPPGSASVGYGFVCAPCGSATFCLEGSAEETPCPSGSYGTTPGQPNPRCSAECPIGTFCPAGSLLPRVCEAGSMCPEESTGLPSPCPGGSTAPLGASSCATCAGGRVSSADLTACELCPVGSWAAPGSSEGGCAPCPSGKYNDALYAGSAEDCTVCEEGKISREPGASYCAAVEAGSIPSANRTAALPCPAGTFSVTGAAACTRCAEGTVAATPGASYCTAVEAGSEPSVDRTAALACPPGTSSKDGIRCMPCADGLVQPAYGERYCDRCPTVGNLVWTSSTTCGCADSFVLEPSNDAKSNVNATTFDQRCTCDKDFALQQARRLQKCRTPTIHISKSFPEKDAPEKS